MAVGSTSNLRSASYALLNIVSASGIVFANKVWKGKEAGKEQERILCLSKLLAATTPTDDDVGKSDCEA